MSQTRTPFVLGLTGLLLIGCDARSRGDHASEAKAAERPSSSAGRSDAKADMPAGRHEEERPMAAAPMSGGVRAGGVLPAASNRPVRSSATWTYEQGARDSGSEACAGGCAVPGGAPTPRDGADH